MHIRELEREDLLLCEGFGQAFHAEKEIPGAFSLESFISHWSSFMTLGLGTIFGLWDDDDRLVGGLGALVTPDVTSGELVASELFWYVDPAFRQTRWSLRLLDRLRVWGREKKATRLRMVHILKPGEDPSTVRLAEIYERYGLRPIEVAYDGPIGV